MKISGENLNSALLFVLTDIFAMQRAQTSIVFRHLAGGDSKKAEAMQSEFLQLFTQFQNATADDLFTRFGDTGLDEIIG